MYLNKRKAKCLEVLTLRVKVHAKNAATERATSGQYGESWDICEGAHLAIQAVLGDREAADILNESRSISEGYQEAIDTLGFYGIDIGSLI